MEIILNNVSCKTEDDYLEKINLVIPHKEIVGLTGTEGNLLLNYLDGHISSTGTITFDNKKRTKKNLEEFKKDVSLVPNKPFFKDFLSTVEEYMKFFLKYYHIPVKNIDKKMKDSLKMVGLDNSYLTVNMEKISKGEMKLIQIALCLLSNPKVILLEEPFLHLETFSQKKLMNLFRMLKEKYNKTIVIMSCDNNLLYENTDYLIVLGNHTCIKTGRTQEIFQDVPFLIANDLEIPVLVYFTYKVKNEKNIRLSYHKDIRDLIKDIYKHV